MSLSELLPTVSSLSRLDKLRLIRWLAEDLSHAEGSASVEEVEMENQDVERLQEAVHAMGLRNAVGRQEEEGPHHAGEDIVTDTDRAMSPPMVTSQPYPYWSPDRDHEASELLMKLLEEEKSASCHSR